MFLHVAVVTLISLQFLNLNVGDFWYIDFYVYDTFCSNSTIIHLVGCTKLVLLILLYNIKRRGSMVER